MNSDADELARRLALAERALMAAETIMSQAREAVENARQAIADTQEAAHREAAVAAGGNGRN